MLQVLLDRTVSKSFVSSLYYTEPVAWWDVPLRHGETAGSAVVRLGLDVDKLNVSLLRPFRLDHTDPPPDVIEKYVNSLDFLQIQVRGDARLGGGWVEIAKRAP